MQNETDKSIVLRFCAKSVIKNHQNRNLGSRNFVFPHPRPLAVIPRQTNPSEKLPFAASAAGIPPVGSIRDRWRPSYLKQICTRHQEMHRKQGVGRLTSKRTAVLVPGAGGDLSRVLPLPASGRSEETYSLVLLFRVAASSFLMSSGDSCGRSMASVILSILPVNVNGTW